VRRRQLDNFLSVTSRKDNKVTGFVLYLPNLTISAEKDGNVWRWTGRSTRSVCRSTRWCTGRVRRRMGRSRITRPAMSHQDSALRALMRLEAHMDIYAIPKILLLGRFGVDVQEPGRDVEGVVAGGDGPRVRHPGR
jgi:hypothetical protein